MALDGYLNEKRSTAIRELERQTRSLGGRSVAQQARHVTYGPQDPPVRKPKARDFAKLDQLLRPGPTASHGELAANIAENNQLSVYEGNNPHRNAGVGRGTERFAARSAPNHFTHVQNGKALVPAGHTTAGPHSNVGGAEHKAWQMRQGLNRPGPKPLGGAGSTVEAFAQRVKQGKDLASRIATSPKTTTAGRFLKGGALLGAGVGAAAEALSSPFTSAEDAAAKAGLGLDSGSVVGDLANRTVNTVDAALSGASLGFAPKVRDIKASGARLGNALSAGLSGLMGLEGYGNAVDEFRAAYNSSTPAAPPANPDAQADSPRPTQAEAEKPKLQETDLGGGARINRDVRGFLGGSTTDQNPTLGDYQTNSDGTVTGHYVDGAGGTAEVTSKDLRLRGGGTVSVVSGPENDLTTARRFNAAADLLRAGRLEREGERERHRLERAARQVPNLNQSLGGFLRTAGQRKSATEAFGRIEAREELARKQAADQASVELGAAKLDQDAAQHRETQALDYAKALSQAQDRDSKRVFKLYEEAAGKDGDPTQLYAQAISRVEALNRGLESIASRNPALVEQAGFAAFPADPSQWTDGMHALAASISKLHNRNKANEGFWDDPSTIEQAIAQLVAL